MNTDKKKQEPAVQPAAPTQTQPAAQYVESDAVRQAKTAVSQPATYKSGWQQQLSDTMKKIQNRQPFSYDINGDALYEQYKNQYITAGKQAMEDTVGKAATMTGGYGNSYAVTAGNQAYNEHLGRLNDVIPELYQMALDRYNAEGDELKEQYALLADREAEDYARWRDSIGDARYADETAYSRDRDAVNDRQWQMEHDQAVKNDNREYVMGMTQFNYGVGQDALDREYDDKVFNYDANQDAYSNLVTKIGATGYNPTDDELQAAGISREEAEAWRSLYEKNTTPAGGGVGGYSIGDIYEAANNIKNGKWDASDANVFISAYGEEAFNELINSGADYKPYGNMSEADFYDNLLDLYYQYSDAEDDEIASSQALTAAMALVKRAGNTMEAKAAFRDYFGDDVYDTRFGERAPANINYDEVEDLISEEDWITAKKSGNQSTVITAFDSYDSYKMAWHQALVAENEALHAKRNAGTYMDYAKATGRYIGE